MNTWHGRPMVYTTWIWFDQSPVPLESLKKKWNRMDCVLYFSFSISFSHSKASISLSLLAIGPSKTCNGVPGLCDLRFNEVTFPATHKSGAYGLTNEEFGEIQPYKQIRQNLATSQRLTFRKQLEAGVRAVDIEPCCSGAENERTVSGTRARGTKERPCRSGAVSALKIISSLFLSSLVFSVIRRIFSIYHFTFFIFSFSSLCTWAAFDSLPKVHFLSIGTSFWYQTTDDIKLVLVILAILPVFIMTPDFSSFWKYN